MTDAWSSYQTVWFSVVSHCFIVLLTWCVYLLFKGFEVIVSTTSCSQTDIFQAFTAICTDKSLFC